MFEFPGYSSLTSSDLSGGQRQRHGYRDQAFYLAELLENTGRFEVTLGEDAAILEMPAIRKYALIIANADRRDPVGQGGRPGGSDFVLGFSKGMKNQKQSPTPRLTQFREGKGGVTE